MPPSRESSSSPGDSTYRGILSRENPDIIDAWNGSNYANTTSTKGAFDRVVFSAEANCTIQEWTDFTHEAINLAYGDLLDHVPQNDRREHTPTVTPTIIKNENGIDNLGIAWTCNIIRAPLKFAGAVLRRRSTLCSQSDKLATEPVLGPGMTWSHPMLVNTELKPDWTAYDRAVEKLYYSSSRKDPQQPLAFAIGESKMCQKWKSDWIHKSLAAGYIDRNPAPTADGEPLQKTHDVGVERLRPLEQLATYCRFGETRYGFILTQQELVAFRVRRLDSRFLPNVVAFDKPFAGFEYKAVPWNEHGSGKLNANLAIWALGCMGMNDHHRIMETSGGQPLGSMVRLTKWTHEAVRQVYRNDISGREIPEDSWKKLGDAVAFVKLDGDKEGASYTRTFTEAGGMPSITRGMRAFNLNTTTGRGRKPSQVAAQQQQPSDQGTASSSKPNPEANSPPKKFSIAGKEGALAYEMAVSNGEKSLKMDDSEVEVKVDSNKKQFYYVDPETKDYVDLAQV